ncbi:hypothetical protein TWF281_005176 [Arthrobotrys megalospora]
MKPTPITKQFQPVYSCIPQSTKYNSKNQQYETVYTTTSYRWISTVVPCYNGVTTMTHLSQQLTIAAYPTNQIETCNCGETGLCYYGTTSTNVARPTAFPYVNAGWEYHVSNYSDYYRWNSGDYSSDYSGATGDKNWEGDRVKGSDSRAGYKVPGNPVTNAQVHPPKASGKNNYGDTWWSKYSHGKGSKGKYVGDGPGYLVKDIQTAVTNDGKSLKLNCHSCMNGLCKIFPIRLATRTHIKTRTVRVPYHVNHYFPRSTVYCVDHLGITLTVSGPTSINTIITGTATATSTVTITDTTTMSKTTSSAASRFDYATAVTPTASTGGGFYLGAGGKYVVCVNNACTLKSSCRGAQVFYLNNYKQLAAYNNAGAVAFANNIDLISGSALFRMGAGDATGSFGFRYQRFPHGRVPPRNYSIGLRASDN